jgi:hypothetical protein
MPPLGASKSQHGSLFVLAPGSSTGPSSLGYEPKALAAQGRELAVTMESSKVAEPFPIPFSTLCANHDDQVEFRQVL